MTLWPSAAFKQVFLFPLLISSNFSPTNTNALYSELKQAVLSRQREYKMAAIHAKQSGNIDQAKLYYLTAKVTEPISVISHEYMYLFV